MADIARKFVELLSQTKDVILSDLQNEYLVLLHQDSDDDVKKLSQILERQTNIVNAVCVKIGFDIEQFENLDKLKGNVISICQAVESIQDAFNELVDTKSKSEDDYAAFVEVFMPATQSILKLVKALRDTEWDEIRREFESNGAEWIDEFDMKEFGRKILDYILVALLKNAKVIFKDEIDYIRMTAGNVVESAQGLVNGLKDSINGSLDDAENKIYTLLGDTLDDVERLKERVGRDFENGLNDLRNGVDELEFSANNMYVKISRAMSITYSILDLLGVIKEKEYNIQLPSRLKETLNDISGTISNCCSKANNSINEISESITENIESAAQQVESCGKTIQEGITDAQNAVGKASETINKKIASSELSISNELIGLSQASCDTLNKQLDFLYGETENATNGFVAVLNGCTPCVENGAKQLNGALAGMSEKAQNALSSIRNLSYPIKITVISWEDLEEIFTNPISHFKKLYPIKCAEDIENLMKRVMEILHSVNPDIPDFKSLANLLETLLKKLQQKAIQLMRNSQSEANDILEKLQPVIATIKNVIEILRELALAIKENIGVVLGEITLSLKPILLQVEDAFSQMINAVKDETTMLGTGIDDTLSKIDSAVNSTIGKVQGTVSHVANEAGVSLQSEIEKHLAEGMRFDKLKVPSLIGNIAKDRLILPVIDVIDDILSSSVDKRCDFHFGSICQLYRLSKDLGCLSIQSVNVNIPNFEVVYSDIVKIVDTQFSVWSYGVLSSIKSFVDPNIWESKMKTVVAQLQAEFENDFKNISSMISRNGVDKLVSDHNSVLKQLRTELSFSDYLTILQTAVEDVVLPNPELYLASFKACLSNIVSQIINVLLTYSANTHSSISVEKQKIEEALKNWVGTLSAENKAAKRRIKEQLDHIDDYVKEYNEFIENAPNYISQIKQKIENNTAEFVDRLYKELTNRLNDLSSELWRIVKSQLINPVVDEVKRHLLWCVKNSLKDILNKVGKYISGIVDVDGKFSVLKSFFENECSMVKTLFLKLDSGTQKKINDFLTDKGKEWENVLEKDTFSFSQMLSLLEYPDIWNLLRSALKANKDLLTSEQNVLEVKTSQNRNCSIQIPSEWWLFVHDVLTSTLEYLQSDMKVKDVITLVSSIYGSLPEEVTDYLYDLMPKLPSLSGTGGNSFADYFKNEVDCKYDLDEKFCNVTLLNKCKGNSSIRINILVFVASYPLPEGDAVESDPDSEDEGDERKAVYFMLNFAGDTAASFDVGEKHEILFRMAAKGGEGNNSIGFCIAQKGEDDDSYFHGMFNVGALAALAFLKFNRKPDFVNDEPIVTSKYLDIKVKDYPQTVYAGYNANEYNENFDLSDLNISQDGGFTAGACTQLNDLEFIIKLKQNAFLGSFLKDDISAKFSVAVSYDYQNGFKIGGKQNFHLDFDCAKLDFGKLKFSGLGIDFGCMSGDWGTWSLDIGSIFDLNLPAISFSFENLGIGFDWNFLKPDFSIGDWDLGGHFKFPEGIGLSIDTSAVKGSGYVGYTKSTGELYGVLELKVVNKFGVSAFLLADLGTVEGHSFNLVALISSSFSPGIPLGMGFSLTGIGGCLGLDRMIDEKSVRKSIRQGTLNSVFFVEDVKNHLSEMKKNVTEMFPAKKDQFFLGLLGQISYEPVLKCNFGLMLQLPNPTQIMILGALNVSIKNSSVIKINVYFGGGIDFEKGIWFDAELVDSKLVGIRLEGSLAFRLYWAGENKGFLLSIGGFHPSYRPEPGMDVANMKRLAMKLDYSILKIGFETYLAITSNTFQIGAQLDLRIGWKKFGIFGYLGFDALFQFDPFQFMFNARAGVSVKCGSWKLLSIDLSLDVSGPAPWSVSGKAKFWFLFIKVNVGFSKTWGERKVSLPKNYASVLQLFLKELDNELNWKSESEDMQDDDVILEVKEKSRCIHPFSGISFNQTSVPINLDRNMDLCNNALPDYTNLRVNGYRIGGEKVHDFESQDYLKNDFAKALFYNMSNEEKLAAASYDKMRSGFVVSAYDSVAVGIQELNNAEIFLTTMPSVPVDLSFNIQDVSNEEKDNSEVLKQARRSMSNLSAKNSSTKAGSARKVNYVRNNRKAFDRYVKMLDTLNVKNK